MVDVPSLLRASVSTLSSACLRPCFAWFLFCSVDVVTQQPVIKKHPEARVKVWHCMSCICRRLQVGPETQTRATSASTFMYTRTHQYAGVIYEHMVKICLHAGVFTGGTYYTRTKKDISSSGTSTSEATVRESPWTQPGPSVKWFKLQQNEEAKRLKLASLLDNKLACLQIEIGVI